MWVTSVVGLDSNNQKLEDNLWHTLWTSEGVSSAIYIVIRCESLSSATPD